MPWPGTKWTWKRGEKWRAKRQKGNQETAVVYFESPLIQRLFSGMPKNMAFCSLWRPRPSQGSMPRRSLWRWPGTCPSQTSARAAGTGTGTGRAQVSGGGEEGEEHFSGLMTKVTVRLETKPVLAANSTSTQVYVRVYWKHRNKHTNKQSHRIIDSTFMVEFI